MILDKLNNAHYYYRLHPSFKRAFEFLMNNDLRRYAAGKYEIDGERIFALVSFGRGRGKEEAKLEVHKRYIDIQFCVSGCDCIGLKLRQNCHVSETEFDAGKDCEFFEDAIEAWFLLPPQMFAIFFPHDAHAPLAGEGDIHKVVVKVQVNGE